MTWTVWTKFALGSFLIDHLHLPWRLLRFSSVRLAVCVGLEYLILYLAGITVDVEVLSHMKLTKYTFNLLQHESTMFFTLKKSCRWSMFSLFAPENKFPADHTEDVRWNFVFTNQVKRLKISFFMMSLSPLPIQRSKSCFVILFSTSMAHLRMIHNGKDVTQSGETGNQNINFQTQRSYL